MSEQESVSVTTPAGAVNLAGRNMIGLLTLLGVFAVGYVLWDHNKAMAAQSVQISAHHSEVVTVMKEMVRAREEGTDALREMNCLIGESARPDRRQFCRDMTTIPGGRPR